MIEEKDATVCSTQQEELKFCRRKKKRASQVGGEIVKVERRTKESFSFIVLSLHGAAFYGRGLGKEQNLCLKKSGE